MNEWMNEWVEIFFGAEWEGCDTQEASSSCMILQQLGWQLYRVKWSFFVHVPWELHETHVCKIASLQWSPPSQVSL
jgi:hypothetical protein